jgi:hypothetical protein
MTAHQPPKGILRKPMRIQRRKKTKMIEKLKSQRKETHD